MYIYMYGAGVALRRECVKSNFLFLKFLTRTHARTRTRTHAHTHTHLASPAEASEREKVLTHFIRVCSTCRSRHRTCHQTARGNKALGFIYVYMYMYMYVLCSLLRYATV